MSCRVILAFGAMYINIERTKPVFAETKSRRAWFEPMTSLSSAPNRFVTREQKWRSRFTEPTVSAVLGGYKFAQGLSGTTSFVCERRVRPDLAYPHPRI